ncbi:MAG: malonic semialdehyde reductase [Rhodospirillales bacterium]|jgi:3-hydroxypropanoate dehydrogenase|nr:malonic semialdehyde reductase [Rhodospirillales bacterium]
MPELPPLSDASIDQIFREARTQNKWLDRPVPDSMLHEIWDISKYGPTSANCSPMRLVFVRSGEAKARLKQALSAGNVEKTMTAPVTAIVAHDPLFYDKLPFLFPHADAKAWFSSSPALAETTAFRNGTLQGAYLMIAARCLGLDVGSMSGFDNAKVDELFFADTGFKSNWLINIGYGDPEGLFPRSPRFGFEEIAKIV